MMLYECDDGNCAVGTDLCNNRAFADLHERRAKGGKYRVGVEVIKTEDRGYGVRANRCFEAGQIIVEYTGEIITEPECQRRMKEDYKDNEVCISQLSPIFLTNASQCYYLMLFDQNMIIDATRGSIARFVNHSCEPNCEMVKWIVGGKPHMALFAGKRPIMTGAELTYDYKFDPFSSRNLQECRCGSASCRGVLGPKPKEVKKPVMTSRDVAKAVKRAVKAGKRKLKVLMEGEDEKVVKKRKIAVPVGRGKGVKAMQKAKEVAKKVAKVAANKSPKKSAVASPKKSPKKVATPAKGLKQAKLFSRNSGLTFVADASEASPKATKKDSTPAKKSAVMATGKRTPKVVRKSLLGKGTPKKVATPKAGSAKKAAATPKTGSAKKVAAAKKAVTPKSAGPKKTIRAVEEEVEAQ